VEVVVIQLYRGQQTVIDAVDWPIVSRFTWHAMPNVMGGYYAATGVSRADGRQTTLYLHRLLMGTPPGLKTDHINHDTLDNRRSNLRVVTNRQNNENRNGAHKNSKTGIRGVPPFRSKSGKMYWAGRVHTPTVKPMAYFPFTENGKLAAAVWVEAKRAELMTHA